MKKNKISVAIVAPSFSEIGGPEIVSKNIAHALKKEGINVVLFSPKDWKVKVKHIPTLEKSICNMSSAEKKGKIKKLRIKSQTKILDHQHGFDIIHLNSQKYAHLFAKRIKKPCLLTFHNKISEPEFLKIKKAGVYAVALSETHGNGLGIDAVIENGIDVYKIKPSFNKGKYLIAIGRIAEIKGIDIAIKIANKSQKKLLIFGRIGKTAERQKYFKQKIKPFLNKNIVYKGEVSQARLFQYLRKAEALISPIRRKVKVCPLIMAEALACGTPIIGTSLNPTPKVFKDPKIACLSNNFNILVKAAKSTEKFDRKKCRKVAEKIFDRSIMAKKYIEFYKKILNEENKKTHNKCR